MINFYRKATILMILLLVFSLIVGALSTKTVYVSDTLFPMSQSRIPWKHDYTSDMELGGSSTLSVDASVNRLSFDYFMTKQYPHPYVSSIMVFSDKERKLEYIDLSEYERVSFKVKCLPRNTLSFHLLSFEETVSTSEDYASYRLARENISCDKDWQAIEIDLHGLSVFPWWLEQNNFEISDQHYRLDRVAGLSFNAGKQGPIGVHANVQIKAVVLHRSNWFYVWSVGAALILIWMAYFVGLFKLYTSALIDEIKLKITQDNTLFTYQALSVEPFKDKKKANLMSFVVSGYTNPKMNIDYVIDELGISRKKVSEYIKDEVGLSFRGYLNKLRLEESVRLLTGTEKLSIAEISHAVGYNNVTYFNTLFRKEYGCTPGKFKELSSRGAFTTSE